MIMIIYTRTGKWTLILHLLSLTNASGGSLKGISLVAMTQISSICIYTPLIAGAFSALVIICYIII